MLGELVLQGGLEIGCYAGAPDLLNDREEAELLLPRGTALRIEQLTAPTAERPYPICRVQALSW